MTIEQLRSFYSAVPFRPFIIKTADGSVYEVRHRDYISVSPSSRTFVVHSLDDSIAVIDLLLVSSLEYPKPTTPAKPVLVDNF